MRWLTVVAAVGVTFASESELTASPSTFAAGVCLPSGGDTCCKVTYPLGPSTPSPTGNAVWYGICGNSSYNAYQAPDAYPSEYGLVGIFSMKTVMGVETVHPSLGIAIDFIAWSSSTVKCESGDDDYDDCVSYCAATKEWGLETKGADVVDTTGTPLDASSAGALGYLLKDGCPYGDAYGGSDTCQGFCNAYICDSPLCAGCTTCHASDIETGVCQSWCSSYLCDYLGYSAFLDQHCGGCDACAVGAR